VNKFLKIAVVLAGYAAAVGLGCLAWWLNDQRVAAFARNSPGMVSEGDSIAFFQVTGLAMIVPTALALFFLRPVAWFWTFFSWGLLALALTGPPLEMIGALLHDLGVMSGPWVLLSFPVVVRTYSIAFLAPGDLISALLAPDPKSRRRLLLALGIEAALGLYVIWNLTFRNRFM